MLDEYQMMISEAMKRVCFSDCADDIFGLWVSEFLNL